MLVNFIYSEVLIF